MGCSLFGSWKQTVTVSSDPPEARVILNGASIGTTPLQHEVKRRGDLFLEIQKPGYKSQYRTTSRRLSTLGILDVIGGAIFLLPFLGLISPAAWEQDPSAFGITLDPAEDSLRSH